MEIYRRVFCSCAATLHPWNYFLNEKYLAQPDCIWPVWETSLAWLSLDQKFLIFRNFASHITQIEKTQPGTRNRKLKINTAGLGVAALMQKLCHSLILNPSWWSRIHKFNYSCAVWSYLSGKLSWLLVRNWGFPHFLLQPDQQVFHLTEYCSHHHHPCICQFNFCLQHTWP